MRSLLRRGTIVVSGVLAVALATMPAAAHVEYTAENAEHEDPLPFFVDVVTEPFNAALLLGGAVAVSLAVIVYLWRLPLRRDVAVFREAVAEYDDLLPWLLRLSFGLPLVGAGFTGYFISPAVTPSGTGLVAVSRLFQIALGFALLFGLATRVAAFVGLVIYLAVATLEPQLWLAMEYVPGFLAIAFLGSGRPSADRVLETVASAEGTVYGRLDPIHRVTSAFRHRVAPYHEYVPTVIRVGLGVNFVYLGLVEKLLAPGTALSVVDKYDLTAVVPVDAGLWVVGAGVVEIALGLALVVGAFTRAGSLVALLMFTLTLFALPDDPVLAHVSLFGLASALIVTGPGPFALDKRLVAWFSPTPTGGDAGASTSGE
ncbi:DoxX family protein [Salinarchaeum chitinilyticum]